MRLGPAQAGHTDPRIAADAWYVDLNLLRPWGHVNDTAVGDRGGPDRLDLALIASLAAFVLGAAFVTLNPDVRTRIVAPSLDLALDSVALVVTSTVAWLAWLRFREGQHPLALYQSAAFLVLAIAYAHAVIGTVRLDLQAMLSTTEPGQDQLYVFLTARLLAATLLVFGGLATLRGWAAKRPTFVVLLPLAFLLAAILMADIVGSLLPPLVRPTVAGAAEARTVTTAGTAIHLVGAGLMIVAVILCRRLWRRDQSLGDAYVAIGLLFAAFALVVGATTPGTHPGPVTSADLLWLAFDIALLLAVQAEARTVLGALRRANQSLAELREADVARAALEERARLSRELHDGLTQDLWLAKLKIGRLAGLGDLGPDARVLVDDATYAIDRGLAEANQAVMAMRIAAADGTFPQLLRQYTEDFEDRFGIRVHVEAPPALPDLPVRTQAELLRIAQEALTNVHRHSGARTVEVSVRSADGGVTLAIVDDGGGFEAGEPRETDFGLLAMRERAALIGGELQIRSNPGAGTRVVVHAPILPGGTSLPTADRPPEGGASRPAPLSSGKPA